MQSSSTRALIIAVCLALAACGKRDQPTPDVAGILVAARNNTPLPASAGYRFPAYQHAMLALVAGEYGGECNSVAGPAPREGVRIDETGEAASNLWRANLISAYASMTLGRTLAAGQAPTVIFSAGGGAKPWSLTVASGHGGHAMFGSGASLAQCTRVSSVADLAAKPLYPAVAQFFAGARGSLNCVEGATSLRETAVKASAAGVSFGQDNFTLNGGLSKESLSVEPQAGSLTYSAGWADGASLSMTLNAAGKLAAAFGKPATGAAFVCSAPAS